MMILSVMGPKTLWEDSWLKVREPKYTTTQNERGEQKKLLSLDNSRVLSPRYERCVQTVSVFLDTTIPSANALDFGKKKINNFLIKRCYGKSDDSTLEVSNKSG